MNNQDYDILSLLLRQGYHNQRKLSQISGYSLGLVNKSIRHLMEEGYLDETMAPTPAAHSLAAESSPKNAVILAAGFGLRMIPINTETPKGLLQVHGEALIERLIRQLQEAGIRDITVVVGFMKEQYEHLIDEFGVKLKVSKDYLSTNNLHSLALVEKRLGNTYIIPCDIWCRNNPFSSIEFYSWYMVSDRMTNDSSLRLNRKSELVPVRENEEGNALVGIAYLTNADAEVIRERLKKRSSDSRFDNAFWEVTLEEKQKFRIPGRLVSHKDVVEINTYEELRELDGHSQQLQTTAISTIAAALDADTQEITDITMLKKGMTNRSFRFMCRGKEYIMRIPGEGTDQLINRREEAAVYHQIMDKNLCDNVAYINPDNGYKVTEFLSPARVCDSESPEDILACMEVLRNFHEMHLTVEHTFDLFHQIRYYQSLWNGAPSVYRDHEKTTRQVFSLKEYIDAQEKDFCLTHIDAVPDNFLFVKREDGTEEIRLIDWEYAGMQDPHVDLAMFSIYSLYEKSQVDALIDAYFRGNCPRSTRIKIYCYIAICGLLWSNWCEYKRSLGVDFGEYSLAQYRYAKDYYRIVQQELAMDTETHTVKRAIIMAAGLGKRMLPLTNTTPKPLITVNGKRMIDTVIEALHKNGIREIHVVVGHLKEAFSSLPEKYPGLTLIENPWYATCNNISSLYCAREHLEDSIILDGDQIIYNPEILSPEFTCSGYNAIWTEKPTEEWLLTLREGQITSCSRTGGEKGWQLYSVSRWTAEDGKKLKNHLEIQFMDKQNRDIYWDDVPMFVYPEEYHLGIREMHREDMKEIDSIQELLDLDDSYKSHLIGGN